MKKVRYLVGLLLASFSLSACGQMSNEFFNKNDSLSSQPNNSSENSNSSGSAIYDSEWGVSLCDDMIDLLGETIPYINLGTLDTDYTGAFTDDDGDFIGICSIEGVANKLTGYGNVLTQRGYSSYLEEEDEGVTYYLYKKDNIIVQYDYVSDGQYNEIYAWLDETGGGSGGGDDEYVDFETTEMVVNYIDALEDAGFEIDTSYAADYGMVYAEYDDVLCIDISSEDGSMNVGISTIDYEVAYGDLFARKNASGASDWPSDLKNDMISVVGEALPFIDIGEIDTEYSGIFEDEEGEYVSICSVEGTDDVLGNYGAILEDAGYVYVNSGEDEGDMVYLYCKDNFLVNYYYYNDYECNCIFAWVADVDDDDDDDDTYTIEDLIDYGYTSASEWPATEVASWVNNSDVTVPAATSETNQYAYYSSNYAEVSLFSGVLPASIDVAVEGNVEDNYKTAVEGANWIVDDSYYDYYGYIAVDATGEYAMVFYYTEDYDCTFISVYHFNEFFGVETTTWPEDIITAMLGTTYASVNIPALTANEFVYIYLVTEEAGAYLTIACEDNSEATTIQVPSTSSWDYDE